MTSTAASPRRVRLVDLGHRFAGQPFLFTGLTADLDAGHVYAVTGPSGSGKSTFLSLLAGWARPAEGTVTTSGIDAIRWVFQNPHGVARRTAVDHVVLPLLAQRMPRAAAEERARRTTHAPVTPAPTSSISRSTNDLGVR